MTARYHARMRRIVLAALALASLGLGARLAWGSLTIGLDFEGGAMFVMHAVDDESIHRALREVGYDRDAQLTKGLVNVRSMSTEDAARFEAALPPGSVEYRTVVPAALSPVLGRPVAVALSVLAALAFLLAAFRPRAIAVALGGWALTIAGCVFMREATGGTLGLPTYFGGAIAGLAAVAVALSAPRFRFGWPGWIVAGVVVGVSILLRTVHDPMLRNAGRLTLLCAPAWLPLGALLAWLASEPKR